jgi:hypothetical protein
MAPHLAGQACASSNLAAAGTNTATKTDLPRQCQEIDRPIAPLLDDLEQRGC